MKVDLSNGFYCVDLSIDDAPKLGVVFPTCPNEEPPVAIPLVLPIGWKNSPLVFSTVTETIADVTNSVISHSVDPLSSHPLGNLAQLQDDDVPAHNALPHSSSSALPSSSSSSSTTTNTRTHSSTFDLLRDPYHPH